MKQTKLSGKSTSTKRSLFSVTLFALATLLFSSCAEDSEMLTDDSALIEKIDTASKEDVSLNNVPSTNAFSGDLADSFAESAEFAAGLGYKVAINTDNAERAEAKTAVYFNLRGELLEDRREKAKKRRHRCFKFQLPITFFMPDSTSITVNEKGDWVLLKEWYVQHPDSTERPSVIFPVNIILADTTVQTLLDIDELIEVKKACKEARDKIKCFSLVLPISYTMADATTITVTTRDEFHLIREWHIANPAIREKGSLNYPVEILFKDGTTKAINDAVEMRAEKESCKG